jgi:membrane fusion protein, multidrug efflux system
MNSSFALCAVLFASLCLGLAGCARNGPETAPAAPPTVSVSYPVEREVTDYVDFTGRTAAVDSVEVRARVFGYLDKVNFKEGTLVKKGDVLFEIDPRTYEAALKQAEGNLEATEARLKRLDADLTRTRDLINQKAASRADLDKVVGDRGEAAASITALKAAVEQAKLDLGFTKVIAPIDGRVSRYLVTVGNLIQAGQSGGTALTTIVSVDPIYVYVDVDERTVQYVRKLIREGKAKSARDADLPIMLGLANDVGYPHRGVLNFVDNQVNPKTGTLRVRGVFPNKDEVLSPGYFARVRVPIGFPHQSLLISERAIDTDQGQKIVYVVDKDNKVAVRPIQLGALHDGLRVVDEGLTPGDQVIVVGLQQVRPGLVVEPKLVDMPVSRDQRSEVAG